MPPELELNNAGGERHSLHFHTDGERDFHQRIKNLDEKQIHPDPFKKESHTTIYMSSVHLCINWLANLFYIPFNRVS